MKESFRDEGYKITSQVEDLIEESIIVGLAECPQGRGLPGLFLPDLIESGFFPIALVKASRLL